MRVRINEICDIQIGYQFREKLDPESEGTHQVIQIKDIDAKADHRLIASNLCRVTPKRDTEKYEVINGDIVFVSKGRRNYATLIEGLGDQDTIVAGYFFILTLTSPDVRPDFLVWAINQPPAQKYLQSVSRGTGIPFIRKDEFAELCINVPDENSQRRIVELHKLSLQETALMDELRNKRLELVRGICVKATKQENPQGENHVK